MPERAFFTALFFFLVFFYGIIKTIMKTKLCIFSLILALCSHSAFAGWEYDGYYLGDGYYNDDGVRFIMSVRGGFSFANANMKNEMGSLYGYYYVDKTNGGVVSELGYINAGGTDSEYWYAGYGDLATLPINGKFSKTSFTAGASVGFTLPYYPQWRLEANYDLISEMNYNQIPLLEGELYVSGGDPEISPTMLHVASTGIVSTLSTDIFSAMLYYDFFDGSVKPANTFIPYIGFGVGYSISKSTLKLTDIYGDLSTDSDLENYGTKNAEGIIQFEPPTNKSDYPTSDNIALVGALGFSYGITQSVFFDVQARVIYIPKIAWYLTNSDASLHREWFAAENMLYTNATIGLRFEF